MVRRSSLLRMILAAFAIFYVAASASVASACAMTEMTMPACGKAASDCTDHQRPDCQQACGTMCVAVEPSTAPVTIARPALQAFAIGQPLELPTGFSGPDPPPPRMG